LSYFHLYACVLSCMRLTVAHFNTK
jgi:hypothetical protein